MKPSRRYFILEEPLPRSDMPLGRVVVDKVRPTRDFAPNEPSPTGDEPPHGLENIRPESKRNEHVWKDWEQFFSHTTDWSVEGGLTSLLGIKHSREVESGMTLKSEEMKMCSLIDTPRCFQDLMKNELFARDVSDLVKRSQKRHLYFVVGFLTTKGGIWKEFISTKKSSKVDVTAPVLEAVGTPLPNNMGDPQVAPGFGNAERMERTMKMEDDVIFALAYDIIKISYGIDWKTRSAVITTITNAGPKIAEANQRALAAEDDGIVDSDEEYEDEYSNTKRTDLISLDFEEGSTAEKFGEPEASSSIAFNLQC